MNQWTFSSITSWNKRSQVEILVLDKPNIAIKRAAILSLVKSALKSGTLN